MSTSPDNRDRSAWDDDEPLDDEVPLNRDEEPEGGDGEESEELDDDEADRPDTTEHTVPASPDDDPPVPDDERPEGGDPDDLNWSRWRTDPNDPVLRRVRKAMAGRPEWLRPHASRAASADRCKKLSARRLKLLDKRSKVEAEILAAVMAFAGATVIEAERRERGAPVPFVTQSDLIGVVTVMLEQTGACRSSKRLERLIKAALWALLNGRTPDGLGDFLWERSVGGCAASFDDLTRYLEAKAVADALEDSGGEGQES